MRQAKQAIQRDAAELRGVGHYLYTHPETANAEFLAVARLTAHLRALGFAVEAPYAGTPTAFRAVLRRGPARGPAVAVLAEYDALPGMGHGCGHHLISVAALAAATGMAGAGPAWRGRFEIIGTPAEEMEGGKVRMLRHGAFQDLDACFMSHPSSDDRVAWGCTALKLFTAEFRGKAAHAALEPERGINALDAAVQFLADVRRLRAALREDERVHCILTRGGTAVNVIPDLAEVKGGVRSLDEGALAALQRQVTRLGRAAAAGAGAGVKVSWKREWYRAFRTNGPLAAALVAGFARAGIALVPGTGREGRASLDMANVSWVVPSEHVWFSIVPPGTPPAAVHTPEFLRLADRPYAYAQALKAGAGMALTAIRLLGDSRAFLTIRQAAE